jgi:predicted metal-dependent hydrolase
MIERTLLYGDQRIPYRVSFKENSIISIHVYSDGRVRVDAPVSAEPRQIKAAVLKRARWIHNHLQAIVDRASHVLPREYVSGESHLYLGRRYVLKVVKDAGAEPSVKLVRGYIRVISPRVDQTTIRSMLWEWYLSRARDVFQRRIENATSGLAWLRNTPRWKLLTMRRQWGSCSPKGRLNLNPHLIKAPSACIDYVILHELCHVQFHNHSRQYYRLLSKHMPNWERVKERLDGMAELLLNR